MLLSALAFRAAPLNFNIKKFFYKPFIKVGRIKIVELIN